MSERSAPERLYSLLRGHLGDYQSLDELGRSLGQPGRSLQPLLAELRQAGAPVELHPLLGCRLLDLPDGLLVWELQYELRTRLFGQHVWVHQEVDSTNDEASRLAGQAAPEGSLVVAEAQRAGRGRRGRAWHSPPGTGLWCSLLLQPPAGVPEGFIALLLGVAIAQTLRRHCGVAALLKWPNDVVASGRKLGGILCELCTPPAGRPVLVSGFGLDVNQDRFPPELDRIATSVYLQTGHRTNRNLLLKDILEGAEKAYLCAAGGGEDLILSQARALCSTLGQQVRADLETGEVRGRACELTRDGGLMIADEDGRPRVLHAGDVHHLRPGQPA